MQEKKLEILEDEIDLKELFTTILKYKYKIAIFSLLATFIAFIYVLSIPNTYKSEVILSPQSDTKTNVGGLASLASLAGVNIGSSAGAKDPFIMLSTTLKDYEFNKNLILKYKLDEKLAKKENLVFAFGVDSVYNFLNSKDDLKNNKDKEAMIFNTNKTLQSILSISNDKKSGLITLSSNYTDRFFAKELVDIYLNELVTKIKAQDMKEIDKQILYYKKELNNTYDVALKEQLSKSLSALMQKRVFSLANDYYFVSKLNDSRVAYIQEKVGPKRALVLMVTFITSIIFSIFLVFFIEFLRNDKKV